MFYNINIVMKAVRMWKAILFIMMISISLSACKGGDGGSDVGVTPSDQSAQPDETSVVVEGEAEDESETDEDAVEEKDPVDEKETKLDFSGEDLSGADMKNKDLSGVSFKDSNLQRADFTGSKMDDADLRGADLTDAKISKKQLAATITDKETVQPNGKNVDSSFWKRQVKRLRKAIKKLRKKIDRLRSKKKKYAKMVRKKRERILDIRDRIKLVNSDILKTRIEFRGKVSVLREDIKRPKGNPARKEKIKELRYKLEKIGDDKKRRLTRLKKKRSQLRGRISKVKERIGKIKSKMKKINDLRKKNIKKVQSKRKKIRRLLAKIKKFD